MQSIRKRNNMVDLLRFITCPFILLIHCPLPGMPGDVIVHFGRYGVPFFLLLSGWFSYTPFAENAAKQARKKLIDTVKLIGTFVIAYCIMNSVVSLLAGEFFLSWIAKHCNFKEIVYLVLFNRATFFGSTGYYPFMLVYVYLIYILLIRYNLLQWAMYLVPVLLTVNIGLGAFTDIPWFCYGNFLFTGLPFFLLGHWLHMHEQKLFRNKTVWAWILLAGTILTYVEAYANRAAYCYVGTVLIAVSLLMLSVNSDYEVRSQVLLQRLQRYSVYIFIVHCGIRDILLTVFNRLQIAYNPYAFPGMVMLLSLLICVVWDGLQVKKKNVKAG